MGAIPTFGSSNIPISRRLHNTHATVFYPLCFDALRLVNSFTDSSELFPVGKKTA